MPPAPTFGPYEILGRIAVGGMAELFLARPIADAGLDRRVVIKALLPELGAAQEHLAHFEQEARLTAAIASEHLVQVYDVGVERGRPYLVLEYVEGVNLAQLLEQGGVLPPLEAAYIGSCLGSALASLHGAVDRDGRALDIVHRDVSPSNVLLSVEGAVKLADLGIAKSRASTHRTQLGTFKGKLAYASPEQVRGDRVDGRADLYALGLVLFEALTGERYLEGDDDVTLLQRALEPEPRSPSELRLGLPSELDAAVRRCLAPLPERRFSSAEALLRALDACQPQGTGQLRAQLAQRVQAAHAALPSSQLLEGGVAPGSLFAPASSPSTGPRRWPWLVAVGLGAALATGISLWLPSWDEAETTAPEQNSSDGAPQPPEREPEPSPVPDPSVQDVAESAPEPDIASATGQAADERPASAVDARPAPQPSPPPDPSPAEDDQAREALAEALTEACQRRERRGLLPEDVPGISAELDQLQAAWERGGAVELERILELQRAVDEVAIDRGFIDAKLRRMNARLGDSATQREDSAELSQRMQRALSLSVSGRYDQANQELNQLAEML
jgi:serine/threonine protein kinase